METRVGRARPGQRAYDLRQLYLDVVIPAIVNEWDRYTRPFFLQARAV